MFVQIKARSFERWIIELLLIPLITLLWLSIQSIPYNKHLLAATQCGRRDFLRLLRPDLGRTHNFCFYPFGMYMSPKVVWVRLQHVGQERPCQVPAIPATLAEVPNMWVHDLGCSHPIDTQPPHPFLTFSLNIIKFLSHHHTVRSWKS